MAGLNRQALLLNMEQDYHKSLSNSFGNKVVCNLKKQSWQLLLNDKLSTFNMPFLDHKKIEPFFQSNPPYMNTLKTNNNFKLNYLSPYYVLFANGWIVDFNLPKEIYFSSLADANKNSLVDEYLSNSLKEEPNDLYLLNNIFISNSRFLFLSSVKGC